MGQVYRESRQGPPSSAPAVGRSVSNGAAAPIGPAARWERIPLPARRLHGHRAPSPVPIVLSVAHGDRATSWAIDPGLVLIVAFALAAIGLGALDSLLFALLMWLF